MSAIAQTNHALLTVEAKTTKCEQVGCAVRDKTEGLRAAVGTEFKA